MKYCTHCGAEIVDEEAVVCVKCGCKVADTKKSNKDNDTLKLIAKIFLIIGTVVMSLCGFLIPLAWCLPITLSICRKMENNESISTGLKVCALLFVNLIAGILLICTDED